MAIDTEAKRRNVTRIMLFPLMIGLNSAAGVDDDDRENSGLGYIGFTYSPPVLPTALYERLHMGVGLSF